MGNVNKLFVFKSLLTTPQQCFAYTFQAIFPTHNLNFHWRQGQKVMGFNPGYLLRSFLLWWFNQNEKTSNKFCKQWNKNQNQYQNSSWQWNLFISFDQLDYRFTKVGINCWSIHWTTTNKLSYLLVHTVVTSWPSHDFYNELKSLLDSISSLTFLWCIGNQREWRVWNKCSPLNKHSRWKIWQKE